MYAFANDIRQREHDIENSKIFKTMAGSFRQSRRNSNTLINNIYRVYFFLSFAGNAGYIVHKSVPYGTVDNSILYLLRRAQENKSVMARTAKESGLLHNEMKRRIWTTLGYA